MYFFRKSSVIEPASAAYDCFRRGSCQSRKHTCTGRRVSDAHFADTENPIAGILDSLSGFNPCEECLFALFHAHGRTFCKVCGSASE